MKRIIFLGMIFLIIFGNLALADNSYFGKVSTAEIKLYFLRSDRNCERIELVPVKCVVPLKGVVQSAIEKLLEGPTEQERKRLDLYTAIPKGVKLNRLQIDLTTGTVYVDFSKELQNYGGGSLNAICIRTQIEETLKQFTVVKKVVITVEGKGEAEGVLQP